MMAFQPVTLKTPRVSLRRIRASDADALYSFYSDPLVTRHLSFPAWTQPEQATRKIESMLAGYESGEHLNLGVESNADGALIGTAGLFRFHETSRRAELGYTLAGLLGTGPDARRSWRSSSVLTYRLAPARGRHRSRNAASRRVSRASAFATRA